MAHERAAGNRGTRGCNFTIRYTEQDDRCARRIRSTRQRPAHCNTRRAKRR